MPTPNPPNSPLCCGARGGKRRVLAIALAFVCAAAACTGTGGDDVAEAEVPADLERSMDTAWTFIDESPGGRRLLVEASTLLTTGSSCTSFEGWTVDETSEQITIIATHRFRPSDGRSCAAVVRGGLFVVELEEPLGNRDVVGCQRAICGTPGRSNEFEPHPVEAIEGRFVVRTLAGDIGFDSTGRLVDTAIVAQLTDSAEWDEALRRRSANPLLAEITSADVTVSGGHNVETVISTADGDVLHQLSLPLGPPAMFWNRLVIFDRGARLTAVDVDTGEVAWIGRGLGEEWQLTEGAIFSIRLRTLQRVDPQTGATVWSLPLGERNRHAVASDGDVVVVTAPLRLDAYSAEDGTHLWTAPLPWPESAAG